MVATTTFRLGGLFEAFSIEDEQHPSSMTRKVQKTNLTGHCLLPDGELAGVLCYFEEEFHQPR